MPTKPSTQAPFLPSERDTVCQFLTEFDLLSDSGGIVFDTPDTMSFQRALSALRSLAEPEDGGRS